MSDVQDGPGRGGGSSRAYTINMRSFPPEGCSIRPAVIASLIACAAGHSSGSDQPGIIGPALGQVAEW